MPAAVAIPFIIGAAGSVGAAAISAHAAGKASDQEQAGAQKALDVQQGIYNQTRQDYAPYRAAGTAALGQLAAYAGAPVVQRSSGRVGYQPGYQPGMTLGGMAQTAAPAGQTPADAQALTGQTLNRALGAVGPLVGSPDPSGGLVMMRAPNGQQKAVKRELVPHYQQMGATVIGGG